MKWNKNILLLALGIYFHSFNRAVITVCSWVMVEKDLLLIPTEGRTWNNILKNCDQMAVLKMQQMVTLSSFQNVHLPPFLTGFTPQCAALFEDFQKWQLGSVTSRLALLLWCGMANSILGVYFKRSLYCNCNECVRQKWFVSLFVWSRPGVGGGTFRLF